MGRRKKEAKGGEYGGHVAVNVLKQWEPNHSGDWTKGGGKAERPLLWLLLLPTTPNPLNSPLTPSFATIVLRPWMAPV